MDDVRFRPCGDRAITAEFENEISIAVNKKVRALQCALETGEIPGVTETVPTYRSLLIQYNPAVIRYVPLVEKVKEKVAGLSALTLPPAMITEIPVCYEGEYAKDLDEIASIEKKSRDEIIRIHSGSDYFVYMLGFAPGHPYTARFENPFSFKRRKSPRERIPGGSIVVQLQLSDIIPFDQPCGWNIIGTTPVLACDFRKENPFCLHSGEWIRHIPVTASEFRSIREKVEAGTYTFARREYKG